MADSVEQSELVNHLRASGFVYQASEIYNGMANAWDYGPLGALMKNNLRALWVRKFITEAPNAVLIDSAIIQRPEVWKASGHVDGFSDPLTDCKKCGRRFRADKLVDDGSITEKTEAKAADAVLKKLKVKCPNCGASDWTGVKTFNLMFKTRVGPAEDEAALAYLRPETAQGIFTNFKNIQRTQRLKLPFAVGQIGKAFRNEITPGNFTFRTREFEQMEIESFCRPEQAREIFDNYVAEINFFLVDDLGIQKDLLRQRQHKKEELAHYSQATTDFEFHFPHGWGELWGLADRGDYDLRVHQEASKADLTYLDEASGERFLPHVVEPSVGTDRLLYAVWTSAYRKERVGDGDERIVLSLKKELSPYACAVLPLVNKLNERAEGLRRELAKQTSRPVAFDTSGSIGKRYRRQDAIGTPFCVTFDFDSLEDGQVTVRDRESMKQRRVPIAALKETLGLVG